MAEKKDHDILIELRTDIRYIKSFVTKNSGNISKLDTRVNGVEDWQEQADGKVKLLLGIATFVGGVVVFLGNKLWDFFMKNA